MALDLNQMCRMCAGLKSTSLTHIFSINGTSILQQMEAINLNTNDDAVLPKNICDICIDQLNQAFAFHEKCLVSEKWFHSQPDIKPDIDNIEVAIVDSDHYAADDSLDFTEPVAPVKAEHQENDQPFICGICAMRKQKRVFWKKRFLRNHMVRMHLSPKQKPFQCPETACHQTFSTQDLLTCHQLRKHADPTSKHQCNYCNKFFSAKTLRDHQRSQHLNVSRHLCTICGKTFLSKSKFKDHTTRHLGSKDFVCPICSRGFVLKGDLNAHIETHSGAKPYICDICGKKYTKPYSLTKHKRVHTGEKPFSCEYCPMTFRESKGKTSHLRTHTGERPYQCTYDGCNKTYSQQCHLKSHERRQHTGEKPYTCDICSKAFTDSNGLKYHRRTHTNERPYKCSFEDCGKAFIQSFELTLHTRSHTGFRPHVCECGSSFMRSSTLKKHKKIHLKQKSNGTGTVAS